MTLNIAVSSAMLAFSAASHAVSIVGTESGAGDNIGTPFAFQASYPNWAYGSNPIAAQSGVSVSSLEGLLTSSAEGKAISESGAVHASALARATAWTNGGGIQATSYSRANAMWGDSFVAHSSSYADGTVATITVDILVDGLAGYQATGANWTASWYWASTVSFNALTIERKGHVLVAPGSSYIYNNDSLVPLRFSTEIVLGEINYVNLSARAEASVGADSPDSEVTSFSDLGNTVKWGGISAFAVNGVQVSDFTATGSESGFDFSLIRTAPVPEPESYAMLLFGLGCIAIRLCRSRRS